MIKVKKIILPAVLILCLIGLVIFTGRFGRSPETVLSENAALASKESLDVANQLFRDTEKAWRNKSTKDIELIDNSSIAHSSGVQISDNYIRISSPGIYRLKSSLTEGQVSVDCKGNVALILDDVNVTNSSDAAVSVTDAEHLLIYLPDGSQSNISSGKQREIISSNANKDVDYASGAAIYSKDNLSIAGSGKLSVSGYINNGIATTDHLIIISGDIDISAVNNGLKGNDLVSILSGNISILSGGDGIQSDRDLSISGGKLDITAGDTSAVSLEESDNHRGPGFMDGNGKMPQQFQHFDGESPVDFTGSDAGFRRPSDNKLRNPMPDNRKDDSQPNNASSTSTKGIKSGGNLTITGGTITIKSADDGIHTDGTLIVSGGDINIIKSKEGMEGNQINIDSGNISITASDDGMNASGGNLPVLRISGGTIYVNANGDGLDSNGDLVIEGGSTIVDGPSNNGNGALDSGSENGGTIVCNAGTILAIGASGMAETFNSNSAQYSFIKDFSEMFTKETQISIYDENEKIIFEHISAKSFNSVVFSSPDLIPGHTYTISVGDKTETVTINK